MTRIISFACMIVLLQISCKYTGQPITGYAGEPFSNNNYRGGPQTIPGKLQCEYFDMGGEGIAFHDSDSINSGSGRLNPVDGSYLHSFRVSEAVDISFTKPGNIDDNDFNFVQPEMDQLYVGWTEPGEWLKYTVLIKQRGTYALSVMYTSRRGAKISLSVEEEDLTGPIEISATYVEQDTVEWRQYHHWNYLKDIAELELHEGLYVITLKILEEGLMNYDYIDFQLKE